MRALAAAASLFLPLSASAAQTLRFSCEADELVSCADVRAELERRLRESGREVTEGAGLPSARLTAAGEGSVRVEVEVRGRPASVRDVRIAGESAPASTLALTVEQVLQLEEAAAERHDVHETPTPQKEPEIGNAVWIGLAAGARYEPVPGGVSVLGGGLGAYSMGRLALRGRAYGEYLDAAPFRSEAFGIAAGPGYLLVAQPSLRLGATLEGFARLVSWQKDSNEPGTGIEAGGALWVDAILGRWAVRPYAALGMELFALRPRLVRRNPDDTCVGDARCPLRPSWATPICQIGLVYSPG